MVNWDFGSRVVARSDTIYVRVWFNSRIKGDVPRYFHDTHTKMTIWKFYAKLVMHAPMGALKCRKNIGHVILGLIIHFLYFINPVFPKYVLLSICAFIRAYFGCSGKFSQHSSFKCIHIFFQKLVMISEFFQRKVGSYLFSQACCF